MVTHPSGEPDHAGERRAEPDDLRALNLWASIAFAFAGLELSSDDGGRDARIRGATLPRSILISAPLIAAAYILGTRSLLWLVPTSDINIVSGFLQAITHRERSGVAASLWWLAPSAAAVVHARQRRRSRRVAHRRRRAWRS